MTVELNVLFFGFYKQELSQLNRIKIIKSTNLHSPLGQRETETKKVNPVVFKRQTVEVIGNWIEEWGTSKPEDERRAFADLLDPHPSAIG